jgi:hypothetical protein
LGRRKQKVMHQREVREEEATGAYLIENGEEEANGAASERGWGGRSIRWCIREKLGRRKQTVLHQREVGRRRKKTVPHLKEVGGVEANWFLFVWRLGRWGWGRRARSL